MRCAGSCAFLSLLLILKLPAPLFKRARGLFDALNAAGLALDTLSMGMSADLEAAVQRQHHGAGGQCHFWLAALRELMPRRWLSGRYFNGSWVVFLTSSITA
jgi:hypothetical protein